MYQLPTRVSLLSVFTLISIVAGCSHEDPLEARLKEVGYTPERIADELEHRLLLLSRSEMGPAGKRAATVSRNKSTKGGHADGPGGNPFTFEAIMDDVNTKVDRLQAKSGENANVAEQVIGRIQVSDLDEELRNRAIAALQR